MGIFPSPLQIARFCWERMKVASYLDEWVVIWVGSALWLLSDLPAFEQAATRSK